jgi:hypothetical protein
MFFAISTFCISISKEEIKEREREDCLKKVSYVAFYYEKEHCTFLRKEICVTISCENQHREKVNFLLQCSKVDSNEHF